MGHRHDHDVYGNPHDLQHYLERLEGADRAEWQQPDAVVRALKLRKHDVACEIGAGPGYFTLRMAKRAGHVFAVEAEPRMLAIFRERLEAAKARNVTPVLASQDDARLPQASCDLILMVNTFHHFHDGAAYLRRLAKALRRGGRIVNVDFHRDAPMGPPPEHKLSRDEFLRIARKAGLRVAREHDFLEHQYFVELELELKPRA